ncbi:Holliday junction branch migration protein RuvA [Pelagibacterium xiamenense]|uniref:Holliday junction branch migration protein RuvA n=1 Tax=Pelagibacterium xiamenense TaxID=2901140 RepID=UPI001E4DA0C6|nr:Holliday junction branch migration protein RuvA [Pelagibacterium xiamenense]MCD7060460.1 Holliday junction branch migration protein RuvA [Pelagibacterium xiamenense]
MIGKLKGLVETIGEDVALIDVNGVCYEAHCSGRTLQALPRVGEATVLFIEMIVREDLIRLYGFATEAEKNWFKLLLSVQGVGSRVALGILSTLSPSDLSSAIALQDKAMVGRAPGVGPKLAQRIVSELKGKVPALGTIDPGVAGLQNALGEGVAPGAVSDAVSALVNLGYAQAQASGAVARIIAKEGEDTPTEKLIRLGLKELSS